MELADVSGPWNPLNQVPLRAWLSHAQSQQDKSRSECMGNIVVPMQAYHASGLLSRMLQM